MHFMNLSAIFMFCTLWLLLLHLLKSFQEVSIIGEEAHVRKWWWGCGAATFSLDQLTPSAPYQ